MMALNGRIGKNGGPAGRYTVFLLHDFDGLNAVVMKAGICFLTEVRWVLDACTQDVARFMTVGLKCTL